MASECLMAGMYFADDTSAQFLTNEEFEV